MFLEYLQKFLNTKSNLFCNIFPDENTKLSCLEGAIKELSLQDNGLSVELVSSQLLGRGFHCGFIGMFQKDIFCLRLQKEFECHIISTPPSVYFQITYTDNKVQIINNPNLVNDKKIKEIAELMLEVTIFIPEKYLGPIKNLCQNYRGILQLQEFKDEISLFNLVYKMPFIEFIDEFNEKLKFLSQGYACLDYKFIGFQTNKIVKVDILLNNQLIPDLSFFSH